MISDDELHENIAAYNRNGGDLNAAARDAGLTYDQIRKRISRARAKGLLEHDGSKLRFLAPDLPSPDTPVEELIEQRTKRFQKRHVADRARQWMTFDVLEEGPCGFAFVGDPHLDDNGCNWPLMRRDVRILQETEGLFGIGLGDYTNNWSGRLSQRIHPYQETTRPQAWALAEWFFAAVPWFLLIKGNHDLWSSAHGTGDPLDFMARGAAPLEDWQCRFVTRFPNGREVRMWVAHDFPGNSIYNRLHSAMRKAKFTGAAELFICGDKHNWAMHQEEDPDRGLTYWAARARGYKFIDEYADRLGYAEQQHGATITAIIDPDLEGPAAIQCFADLEEAARYLTWRRQVWSDSKGD